jgi:hypothetical protein
VRELIAITAMGLLAACSAYRPVVVSHRGTSTYSSHSSTAKLRPSYTTTNATYDADAPPSSDAQRRQEAYADSQARVAQERIDQAQGSLTKAQEQKAEADARLRLIRDNPKPAAYPQY